jgi:hypothetical protein
MDYATAFVHEFTNQLALVEHRRRSMIAYYLFDDKRPGTVIERFEADAAQHAAYTKLFVV